VIWQQLLARTGHTSLLLPARLGLFLAVWAVYLGDRILDARKPARPGTAEPARHRFARRHSRPLTWLLTAVLLAAGGVSLFLRTAILEAAFIAAAGVTAYLALVHWSRGGRFVLTKEALVAILFAIGTSVAPLVRAVEAYRAAVVVSAVLAAATFYLNLVGIEYHEWSIGANPERPRASTILIGQHLYSVAMALAGTAAVIAVLFAEVSWDLMAISVSCGLLGLVQRSSMKLEPEAVRVLWDFVLLSPLLLLI
jgi:Ca2+/Na+ antiporter